VIAHLQLKEGGVLKNTFLSLLEVAVGIESLGFFQDERIFF